MTETKDKANSCKSRWKFFLTKSADLLHIYPDPLWDHLTEVVHEYSTYCFQVTFCHHQLPLGLLFNCKTYFCKKIKTRENAHIHHPSCHSDDPITGKTRATNMTVYDRCWPMKTETRIFCQACVWIFFFSSALKRANKTSIAYCCNLNDFEVVFLLGLRVLLYWTTRRTISETMYALLHLKVISQRKKMIMFGFTVEI